MKQSLVVRIIFCQLCLTLCPALRAQQPTATDLLGKPFYIKTTWMIGGFAPWNSLKLDSSTLQLLIPRGQSVQVVDIETGVVAGEIHGLQDTQAIALDDRGQFGFISDGNANRVAIFDRRTLQIVAKIPTGPNPSAIVYEPSTGLVFAICGQPTPAQYDTYTTGGRLGRKEPPTPPKPPQAPLNPPVESIITVIDAESQQALVNILLSGRASFAQTDGQGRIFINLVDQHALALLDAQGIRNRLSMQPDMPPDKQTSQAKEPSTPENPPAIPQPPLWDWTQILLQTIPGPLRQHQPPDGLLQKFIVPLASNCTAPQSMAIDNTHLRLFLTCANQKLAVIDATTANLVTTVPTRSTTSAVAYDAPRGLLFVASGENGGNLTIIRQNVNDSYSVVQNLPTAYRARVMDINPASGELYLATDGGQSDEPKLRYSPSGKVIPPTKSAYPAPTPKSSFHVIVIDQ